ncbi:MAG: adenylate/guanylate cyclase domain-containing protein [Candidatus Riflebacteria bacterium]|nr:adenylate/guanylate cyclase domain-containing protein [Candidatus Riflebacteria bacterium]
MLTPLFKKEISVIYSFHPDIGELQFSMEPSHDFVIIADKPTSGKKNLRTGIYEILKTQLGLKNRRENIAKEQYTQALVDTLAELMGREAIYNMLFNQNQLSLWKLPFEDFWTFRQIGYGTDNKAKYIFICILNRSDIMFRQAFENTEIFQIKGATYPEIALFEHRNYFNSKMFPENFADNTFLQLSLNKIAENDSSKIILPGKIEEKNFLALSRKMERLDFQGMAIAPWNNEPNNRWKFWMLGLLFYPIGLVILMGKFFQKQFSAPFLETKLGLEKMASGKYNLRLDETMKDEIGELRKAFNKMSEGLQQKEYLSRFMSELAVEAIGRDEKPPVAKIKAAVLFADIRGFTTMSEQLDGTKIVQTLNEHFTDMEEIIQKFGGTVEKFIGDAVMAVFLPAHSAANPVSRASFAGMEMVKRTREKNPDRAARDLPEIKIGVGIAYGEILMGVLGEDAAKKEYAVTGVVVNKAAQMEKLSKLGKHTNVILCPDSREQTKDMWKFKALKTTEAKTSAWEITSESFEIPKRTT